MNAAASDVDSTVPAGALGSRPSVDELLARVRALKPALRERGQKADQLRRIPEETVADFIKAGIPLIGQPVRFGGMGYGQDVICKVSVEVSSACGAAGWLACFFAAHNFVIGLLPEEGQLEIFGDGKPVLCSTVSTAGVMNYEEVEGGMRLSGKVRFSSGVDVSNWLLIIGPKGLLALPKRDFKIDDDWHVMGMKGTGSKGIVLENVFVPNRRIVSGEAMAKYQTYAAAHYEAIHYRLPMASWSPASQTSVILGMAKGILELFDERIRTRKDPHTLQKAIERPGWQMRFAEAAAEVEAASALFEAIHRDFEAWHAAGGRVSAEERARIRRNLVYVAKLSVQAANRLFDGGDASVIYDSNPIQRFFRDIRVAAISISQVWDEPAIQYSRAHWGLPVETMF